LIHTPLQNRVLRVLGDLCNGSIDPRDGHWLEELLCHDEQVQALYVDYMAMHACLHAESIALEEPDRSAAVQASTVQQRLPRGKFSSWLQDSPRQYVALAAALVGIALFTSWAMYRAVSRFEQLAEKSRTSESGSEAAGSAQRQFVAQITGTQNCLWGQAGGVIGYGSQLVAGQELHLLEGLAEITFDHGATVLLESPATFVVDAPHEVALHTGRMAAVVPRESRGFHVHTRTLDIFDVGTEFGLLVHESGSAEVHVFNGLVKADVLDSAGRPFRRLELNASEAARVSPVSTTVLEFPANEGAFVRSMLSSLGPQDGLLAYEGFHYPEGPLSAKNGGFGWAGPWFNIAADSEAGPDSNRVSVGSLTTEGIVPLGNRAAQTAQQNRIRRSLATSVGSVFDEAGLVENQDGVRLVGRDGNQVYLSFLQRVSENDGTFYGLELHRGDGNPNRVLCIGSGVEETGYGATSNYNAYGLRNFPSLGRENIEANLIVLKISFGVDNRDTLEVFRNPESLRNEQTCSVDAVLKGNFAFDRVSLGNFHGSKIHEVDEIRVGTHFLAVTGRWGGKRGRLLRRITSLTRPASPTEPRSFDLYSVAHSGIGQPWNRGRVHQVPRSGVAAFFSQAKFVY